MESTVDRSTYIGGSAASAIMGENKYRTILDVWEHMTGRRGDKDLSDNPHVERGNYLEPYVEDWIRHNLDETINDEKSYVMWDDGGGHGGQIFLRHPEYEWIGGHPDGIGFANNMKPELHEEWCIYEIKCPTSYAVKKLKAHGANSRYYFQVQHYMLATGIKHAFLVVWDCDEWTGYPIYIPANPELHEQMIEAYKDFMFCVEMDTRPAPIEYNYETPETLEAPELDEYLRMTYEAKEKKRKANEKYKRGKGQLITLANGAERIVGEEYGAKIIYDYGKYNSKRLTISKR